MELGYSIICINFVTQSNHKRLFLGVRVRGFYLLLYSIALKTLSLPLHDLPQKAVRHTTQSLNTLITSN